MAERFETLRFRASRPVKVEEAAIREQVLQERGDAAHDFEAIRLVSGHEDFLLEPRTDELTTYGKGGAIIVVNITDIGADAILVTANGIKEIPLPKLSLTHGNSRLKHKFQ